MNSELKPAIVISSYTAGWGVIRDLSMAHVPVVVVYYDKRDMGYVSSHVNSVIEVPHPEKCEGQFIQKMLEVAKCFPGSLIIPTSDAALATTSRYKELLDQHFIVACTEWQITKLFLEKKNTYSLAETVGVPVPRTIIPHSIEDIENYGRSILYPCLIKPSLSHRFYAVFKTKMIIVNDIDSMISVYRQATDAGLEVMLQEFIPGADNLGVNYNSYFWDGEPLVEFTAEKVRNSPPGLGSPRVVLSKYIPEVIEPGRKILKAMNFYGFSCTEFKKDPRDGIYKLMEVNGRHNLSNRLAVHCGINFPWMQYKHLVLGELPVAQDYKTGIYWIDITRDIGASLKHYRSERFSFKDYIGPYLHSHIFAIFDMKDPKPFIKRCIDLVKEAKLPS